MGRVCAVITAAGKGTRMGTKVNKQFIQLKNKPILFYTLNAFCNNEIIDEVIITARKDDIGYIRNTIINAYKLPKVKDIVIGGAERQDSVFNALKYVEDCEIVLIHDGARPFISSEIIKKSVEHARKYAAAACGVIPKDTIKIRGVNGFSEKTLDRSSLFCVQTPQSFKFDLIYDCHKKCFEDGLKYTDDTAVVEAYGNEVYLYEGSYTNIKITTPEDIATAERIMEGLNV